MTALFTDVDDLTIRPRLLDNVALQLGGLLLDSPSHQTGNFLNVVDSFSTKSYLGLISTANFLTVVTA